VRVGWNVGKIKGYSEGDLEGGPMRLAVGASYKVDLADLDKGSAESLADNLQHGAQIDAMLKVEGLAVLVGGYLMKLRGGDAEIGALAQASYFVTPKKMQVAARFAMVPAGDNNTIEARGAFNWYWQGHNWKWATDAGILTETGGGDPTIQVRSMAQLSF